MFGEDRTLNWRDKMLERLTALLDKVEDERRSLSPFRKIEAEALALTPDERKEVRELSAILDLCEEHSYKFT